MDRTGKGRIRALLIDNQGLLLLLISFASLLFLLRQNWLLRDQLATCAERTQSVTDKLRLSQELMQLVGAPIPLASQLRETAAGANPDGDRIVVVFNPTTCGSDLRKHLSTIHAFQERLGPKRVAFFGLVGADTLEDQSYTLNLRNARLMTFPFSYVRSRELARLFPLEAESGFNEAPIYLLVDRDLRVKSVFKPESIEPQGLERWLETRIAA